MTKNEILANIAANKVEIARLEGRNKELSRELVEKHWIGWIVIIDPSHTDVAPEARPIGPLDPIEHGPVYIVPSEKDGVPTVHLEMIPPDNDDGEARPYEISGQPIRFGEESVVWATWFASEPVEGRPEYSIQFFATEAEAHAALLRPAPIMTPLTWAVVTCAAMDRLPERSELCEVISAYTEVAFKHYVQLKLTATNAGGAIKPRVKMAHVVSCAGRLEKVWTEWHECVIGAPVTFSIPITTYERLVTVCCYATEAEARAAMPAPEPANNTPPA